MSKQQIKKKGDWGKIVLTDKAFYSMDNTMEEVVFLLAKEFMLRIGNKQYEQYKACKEVESNSLDDAHVKARLKMYKKISKAIKKIEQATENNGFDSIVNEDLSKYANVLWHNRGIFWF